MHNILKRAIPVLLLLALVIGALVLWVQRSAPRLSERQIRDTVMVTLQREADTSFVITGYLQLATTVRAQDTRVLFPNLLDLPLGTTSVTVRVPGRVSYGFDTSQLQPEMIRLVGDTLEVELPELAIYSAEPDLSELQVETVNGWARFPVVAQDAERRAIQHLGQALRGQGEAHLEDALQPRVNTARTLQRLLTPPLQAMGFADPQYKIRMGEGLLIEPPGN